MPTMDLVNTESEFKYANSYYNLNLKYFRLRTIFGESKRPVEKDDLQQMEYLEAFICETLRLYPPIPAVSRDADKDLQISECFLHKLKLTFICIMKMIQKIYVFKYAFNTSDL